MNFKNYLVVIPGIVLAFVFYTLSQGFNNIIGIEFFGYTKSPISTAMIAILLGIFFGNIFTGKYLDCGTLSGYINSSIQIFKGK